MCENTLKFKAVHYLSYVYYMTLIKRVSLSLLELIVKYEKVPENNDICS